MKDNRALETLGIRTVADLKKSIIAHAIVSGNTYAFHDLFSSVKEFAPGGDEAEVNQVLMDHLNYLLPAQELKDSFEYHNALKLVEKHVLRGDIVPGALLEEAAKNAVAQEKFAYAEDAYRLLGIKKEMIALYAQRGEQFVQEGKPSHGAMAFLVAASLDRPIGPHFQYLGPQLHEECLRNPRVCVTILPVDDLLDAAIQFLLSHEGLSERLLKVTPADQKRAVLGTLARYRDEDLDELVRNLRKAVEAASAIQDGKPDDYSPIGPLLLGRATTSDQPWQYLRELSYQHPICAFCVCVRLMRDKPVLTPIVRDGKSLIEFLLPPEMLKG